MTRANKKRRSGRDHDNNKKKKIEKKIEIKGPCFVPGEIQRQILLRLPVKSLMRFRSLNKRSHCLISTQRFVTDHLNTFQHQNKRQFLLLPPESSHTPLYCQFVDGSVRSAYVEDLTPPPPTGEVDNHLVRVVGYCDGVVCMIRRWCHIQLWNPSIRKMTEVVSDLIPRGYDFGNLDDKIFGFGSVDGEHKLIVFSSDYISLSTYVFSMKTRNWATVKRHQHCGAYWVSSKRSAFVNGACHWLAQGSRTCFVLSFNLKEFGKIDLPNYLGSAVALSVYNGCLSLIASMQMDDPCFVWVMTKYDVVDSWTRIMENKSLRCVQDVVGIRGGDAFVLSRYAFGGTTHKLLCYKPTRKRAQLLKADVKSLTQLYDYRESLALLNQDVPSSGELN